MKRAEIVEPNKPLVLSYAEIPTPPKEGLVIRTACSGVCHSDVLQWENVVDYGSTKKLYTDSLVYKLPIAPGHEMSGTIISLGAEQKNETLHIGDRVVVYPWRGCSGCGYCSKKCFNWCRNRDRCFGFAIPGGYASHVVVPESSLVLKVSESIPMDVACTLPCSGVTTYNAVSHVKPIVETAVAHEGRGSLLIVGAGGLGLWCLQIARVLLPSNTKIVVADVKEDKLSVAQKLGCDDVVLWPRDAGDKDLIDATKSKGLRDGFDAIIDLVNMKSTCERAFNCLLPHGIQVMVGLFGGAATFSLPQVALHSNCIQGVHVGSFGQLEELIDLVAANKIHPPPIRHFPLEDVNLAMNLMMQGKIEGRAILKLDESA